MSIIKNTFGQYFPSLHSLSDKESNAQVKLKIGNKDHSAQIEGKIFITIDKLPEKFWKRRKSPGAAIPFDEFMYLFDGTPFDETYELFRYLCKGKGIYTLKEIDGWIKELFSDRGKAVLAKLKAEKGLSETTIKKYKIGYDPENELIIFPYLNYTKKGVSAINFYSAKNLKYVNNYGGDRLFGYHDIIKGQYKLGYIFVAIDEFEAILLRQLGYNAISPFCVWRHYFEEHLGPFYVLIYNDELIETVNWRFDTIDNTCNGVYSIKFGDNTICDLVLNKGYDKQKLDELIQKKESLNGQHYANLVGYRDFLSKNELKFIEFSQFLYNGIQYYGVLGGKEMHLISGERANENIQLFLAANPNIRFENKSDFKSSFSSEGYKRYLLDGYTPSEKSVFTKIIEYLKDYIYLPDEKLYKFIALWVMGTYFYLNFKYFPYIHLRAPKASGKTLLLEVLSHICFNASFDLGPTAAVIFRQINTYQSTILLDEVENFKNNSGQRGILQILNQGYSSEGRVHRSQGQGFVSYKVFSPKIFAGINKINDVLLSRSIKVPIEKKPIGVKLKRFRVDSKLEKRIQRINDDLYIFGLLYAPEVNKIDKIIHELPETEDLQNREIDTWGPIFSIAKVVDKAGKLGLINDLQEHVELDRKLKTENFEEDESKLHNFLKEYLTKENMLKKNRKKEMIFSRDDLFDAAKSKSVLPKDVDSVNKLTSYLKKEYQITSENVDVDGNKNKKYVVTKALLEKHFPSDTKTAPTQPQTSPTSAKAKVVTKTKTSLYVPENVIITDGAKKYKTTDEILVRIKKLNPKINISYSKSENPKLPSLKTSEERYHHMKKTIVLACRKSSFIETFPSPGRIIEKPNTMIKSVLNCSYQCMFCYLQTTAVRHYHQKVFVNTEIIEQEIKNEFLIDPMIRSMLTIISKLGGKDLDKIPSKFNTVMNHARDALSNMGKNIITEQEVVKYLDKNCLLMLQDMGLKYETKVARAIVKKLDKIYQENKNFVPTFNISEYTDIVGIDHYSNQLEYFMKLIQKIDQLKISFSTRSVNFTNILKYSGKNRVIITQQIDPQYVIDNYQIGTPSLTERIDVVKQILKTKGFQLKLNMEPIVMYKGYEKDYIDLINTMAKNIDLNQVESIGFGGLRADNNLQTNIRKNYPNTDLLNLEHELKKSNGETKQRYPLDERVKVYKKLKEEIEKHTKSRISLGAENPEAWEQAGITIKKASDYYYKLK